jgi:cation diffusion facilitator CzcD-associated flavoprotein CzcO
VPRIQPLVERLTLFQRTPSWITPRRDREVATWRRWLYRLLPFTQRFVRSRIYWRNELLATGFVHQSRVLKLGMRLAQRHLRAQVPDAELRAKLTPNYTLGCKRVLVSDDFYPALCQPNVEVVTEAIREVRPHSIVAGDGKEYEVDAIICGTGFHVTDTQFPWRIYGREGRSLGEEWQTQISAYRGTTVAGFPNLFLMIGPNTGLGHNSMVFMIEAQITYLLDCLQTMERKQVRAVEVRAQSQKAFNQEIQQRLKKTVWLSGCASWYLDANGRNTTLWPGFTFDFWKQMRHFDAQNYHLYPASTEGTDKPSQSS